MSAITIRLPDDEKRRLVESARKAGISASALVRQLLRDAPLVTGEDLLREIERVLGDPERKRLRVSRR